MPLPFLESNVSTFLEEAKIEYKDFKYKLESGRDILIEKNSYQDIVAKEILHNLSVFEKENTPKYFLEDIFEAIGVRHEELNQFSYLLAPTENMLIPSFPGITEEGLTITYDREYALKYPQVQLMTWENPIAQTTIDLLLNGPIGNCVIAKSEELPRNIYFEFIVKLFCSDKYKHQSGLYLPFTPLRVLMNAQGEDLTKRFPKKMVDRTLLEIDNHTKEELGILPKEHIVPLFKKALQLAEKKKEMFIKKGLEKLEVKRKIEIERFSQMPNDKSIQDQLSHLQEEFSATKWGIENPSLVIDSFRLIISQD